MHNVVSTLSDSFLFCIKEPEKNQRVIAINTRAIETT